MLESKAIKEILPHAYPFLLVDRVEELEPGVRIKAVKNVTINEPFFQGHFPGEPIMPGVLIVEAMAQAGGILGVKSFGKEGQDFLMLFMGIDKARFRRLVVPGDQLILEVGFIKIRGEIVRLQGKALVNGEVAAEAELLAAIRQRD